MNLMFPRAAQACLTNIFIGLLIVFSIGFISSCNNSSGNNSAETGTVSFRIEWPADAGDNIEVSQWIVKDYGSETSETLVSATPVTLSDDCQSRGIVTVAVNVTDALETFSVSEQFACDQGVGKINISAGTGRHFIVSGLGGDGTERYHGEKQDITIHAGSNDIGVIQMERNSEFCTDADGDGYYAERDCGTAIDCNDRNADIYPGAMEICGDGRDQDCDGKETACQPVPADVDDDGDGYSENQGDCNDRNANIFPGAVEICDNLDNDCDGSVDEGNVCQTCTDADKDGYYKENGCGSDPDCNDTNAGINPGAAEDCDDGKDNDCDGLIDCDDPDCDAVCNPCTDADGDGFFAEANCGTKVDCDDNDASVHPGASEICDDGIDQNCDGNIDEECFDLTGRWAIDASWKTEKLYATITQNGTNLELILDISPDDKDAGELDGSICTFTIGAHDGNENPITITMSGTVSNGGNKIINGTAQSDGDPLGTWSAERIGAGGTCSDYDFSLYFPLNTGDTWSYNDRSEGLTGMQVYQIKTVMGPETVNGVNVIRVNDVRTIDSHGGYEYWISDNEGIKFYGENGDFINPPWVHINKYTCLGDGISYPQHNVYTKIVAVEDVTVPAGTFKDCLKMKIDDEGSVTYRWFAKNVGYVKKIIPSTGEGDRELVEATVNGIHYGGGN